MAPEISIVIPTYQEKENIALLLPRIFDVFKQYSIDGELIVIDDDSPDGTASEAARRGAAVIVRKNQRGLATACLEGFRACKGNIIIVMDADLQHPPEIIPQLLQGVREGNDIVIAIRPQVRSIHIVGPRRVLSMVASASAKFLFKRARFVNDICSGFFAFKKEVIKDIDLTPMGYKILLEIIVRGHYQRVKEINYQFLERCEGKSKFDLKVIFLYIVHLMKLFLKRNDMFKSHTGK
jgi:dolichol-phosphate mannosyltransferase